MIGSLRCFDRRLMIRVRLVRDDLKFQKTTGGDQFFDAFDFRSPHFGDDDFDLDEEILAELDHTAEFFTTEEEPEEEVFDDDEVDEVYFDDEDDS